MGMALLRCLCTNINEIRGLQTGDQEMENDPVESNQNDEVMTLVSRKKRMVWSKSPKERRSRRADFMSEACAGATCCAKVS